MGKAITYLTILIFLDLFFVATGQICSGTTPCTLTSILFNAVLDLGNLSVSQFMAQLFGDIFDFVGSPTGIISILAGAIGVTIGSLVTRSDSLLFLSTAGLALGVLASDFVVIFRYLFSLNPVLAIFVMAPTMIIFVLVIVDWSRGKD